MDGGDFDFLLGQPGGNLIRAIALQCHGEDAPDDGGSFLVHNPVLPLLVPQVAVNDGSGHVLAAHALCLEHGFYLSAGITGIKLIHDVLSVEKKDATLYLLNHNRYRVVQILRRFYTYPQ